MATGPNKIRLSTNPTDDAIAALQIGDIVYLDGTIYTAREGVYMRVIARMGLICHLICRLYRRPIFIAHRRPPSMMMDLLCWVR